MRKISSIVLVLLISTKVFGQSSAPILKKDSSVLYQKYMREANASFGKEQYADAKKKFGSARTTAQKHHTSTSEAQAGIDKVDKVINKISADLIIAKNETKAANEKFEKIRSEPSFVEAQKIMAVKKIKQEGKPIGLDPNLAEGPSVVTSTSDKSNSPADQTTRNAPKKSQPRSLFFPKPYHTRNTITQEGLISDCKKLLVSLDSQKTLELYDTTENAFIEHTDDQIYGINYLKKARNLYDSTSNILSQTNKPDELVVYLHLRSSLYYIWDLIDESTWNPGISDSVKYVLQNTIHLTTDNKFNSARINYGLAGFENVLRKYYSNNEDPLNSHKHAVLAAEYARMAVSKNPTSPYYLRSFFTYLNNLKWAPDSILSQSEKASLRSLRCQLADFIVNNADNRSVAMDVKLQCVITNADELLVQNRKNEAIELLKQAISDVEAQKLTNKFSDYRPALLATIYNKLCEIYNFHMHDKVNHKLYTQKASESLGTFLSREMSSQSLMDKLETIFDDLVSNSFASMDEAERIKLYKDVLIAIEESNNDYLNLHNIAYIYVNANASLGELLLAQKTGRDSLQALNCLSNAVEVFEKGEFLKHYNKFSEDYARFCKIYRKSVEMYVSQNNYVMARKNYNAMVRIFTPILNKYRFDFYLIQPFLGSSKIYGEFLFKKERYKESLQPLEFASVEGIKKSTGYLISIYKNPSSGLADSSRLQQLIKRYSYQSETIKKFSIPTQFWATKSPFDVYVLDRDPEYPFQGIDDQVIWVKEARGGIIPKDVAESFRKLQQLAWKNNVSYTELCVYALGAASDEKYLEKYKPLKLKIELEKDRNKKEVLFSGLMAQYEADIQKNLENKTAVIKDAVNQNNEYAALLLSNKKIKKAAEIYKKSLQLDKDNTDAKRGLDRVTFEQNKGNVSALAKSTDTDQLKSYLRLYLDANDSINASMIKQKILKIKDNVQIRDEISGIYLLKTGDSDFKSLFLSDPARLKTYKDYFVAKDRDSMLTDAVRRVHYSNLIMLEEKYLEQLPKDSVVVTKALSSHYNSFGWYCLLTKRFSNTTYYFTKSIQLDKANVYPWGNLPTSYLFNDQFDKARDLYVKLMDIEFSKEAGYPTFKDAFLSDFKEFEKLGITHPRMNEIKELLMKK